MAGFVLRRTCWLRAGAAFSSGVVCAKSGSLSGTKREEETNRDLLETRPKNLARKVRNPNGVYITHAELAGVVLKNLCPMPSKETAVLFEANPGPGIVTRALLDAGVPQLKAFEHKTEFLPQLKDLQERYSSRLTLVTEDFFDLAKLVHRDRLTVGTTVENILAAIPVVPWQSAPPVKVFGVLSPRKEARFMRYLLLSLSELSSLFSHGRAQFLFFMSGKEFEYMMADPRSCFLKYRSVSVLYKILFDIEVLHKEPRSAFFPPMCKVTAKRLQYDQDHLYLVRLTPKQNLFDFFETPRRLREFYFFVRQSLTKRSAYVVASLEKWIPSCGPRLIKHGISIFTRFGDLRPDEILWLFQQFASWPEYSCCTFQHALLRNAGEYDEVALFEDEEEDGGEEEEEEED